MRITLVGPGRAGTALALAARAAGHDIVAVMARRLESARDAAVGLGNPEALPLHADLPQSDLVVIATRDEAIEKVADELSRRADAAAAAVHLSGLAPVTALDALAGRGLAVGSFHPLQTLPAPRAGAKRLRGAWFAVTTGDEELRAKLHDLALSLGGHPFDLADEAKPLYHAGAAAAANFSLAALAMASDLFEAAGVPFEAAGPLVEAVVANAFEFGPRAALTGPVARGDVSTVVAQLRAVASAAPEVAAGFAAFVAELARITDQDERFRDIVESGEAQWS